MRRRGTPTPAPLPQRRGVDPVRMRLPLDGEWATVAEYLAHRLPARLGERLDEMVRGGEIVATDGPIDARTPYRPGTSVWFHRDLPPEVPVPFPLDVLHRDERLVVLDKPHFLATMPRGSHVVETALSRLRDELDLPALVPAHRLDRLTAGLVMFVADPAARGAYQTLFRDRLVRKEYRAVAPYRADLELPVTVRSRMVKVPGELAAWEEPGEVNAVSEVELLERRGDLALYRLLPHTGRTHQLRLHMCSLGVPITNDPIYPQVLPATVPDDFSAPLQLLAVGLDFTDPITGRELSLRSRRTLSAWEA
ncbi:pseudouridine synthase [Kitasatospora viridis]|uniref:RNA pseudouridylate synthase n=1 Tax=Kitasatospora viridis TaxID=281105 RepID=A0A561TTY6_9ACTN|nr:pseudouridine synthase [Kitasatospora viridis]TWF90570.1 tRNA pseudouridine32 synthase/23S rRNA pseudouridine746 synthase [Kitasatospora viridis]